MDAQRPKLCPILTVGKDHADVGMWEAMQSTSPVDCVILAPPAGAELIAADVAPLVERIQASSVACLLWADARLARTIKADGVHLPWSSSLAVAYRTAREILDARAIVGIDAGRSRHDAMMLAEMEASYIGFGAPLSLQDRDRAVMRRAELVAWWSEIFEVPVVALDVASTEEADILISAGADFLGTAIAGADDLGKLADIARAAEALEAS